MLSGMQDAGAIARYLRKSDYKLDLILCSSSARTTQTGGTDAAGTWKARSSIATISIWPTPSRSAGGGPRSAGRRHQPDDGGPQSGAGEHCATLLAREPVRRKERARHEALEEKFPTSALAILDFDVGRWRDVAQGAGKLVDFVRPKDLEDFSSANLIKKSAIHPTDGIRIWLCHVGRHGTGASIGEASPLSQLFSQRRRHLGNDRDGCLDASGVVRRVSPPRARAAEPAAGNCLRLRHGAQTTTRADQDGSVRACLRAASLFQPKPISGVSSPISRVVRVATRRPPIAS